MNREKIEGFSYMDLSGLELSDRKFKDVDFSGCTLDGASFSHCEFINCKFNHAGMNGISVYQTLFRGCEFNETQIRGGDFYFVSIVDSVVKECSFLGTKFCRSALEINWDHQTCGHTTVDREFVGSPDENAE